MGEVDGEQRVTGGHLEAVWEVVRSIPSGKVMSYGDVGRLLPTPASGWQVGRWMASAPEGVPWWRVVAKNGARPIARRASSLAKEQVQRLEDEGVPFSSPGVVDMSRAAA